ncbi:hypothetical protein [Parvibaculum sp.]|uniref:DUF7940 domain-containing protein n=1 Tax=Parvibaculum sp. TaxID=2024848 RepID=UPI002D0A036D|nr:hypothetical protein [Parvibaculum sp.]HUD52793.1 hypothetical protein [Parvibaculum sp.]
MKLSEIWDRLKDRLVDDARDVWKWWSTWLYLAIGVAGAVAVGLQAMPREFQDCVSISFPRWLVIGMSVLALLGPLVRVVKQGRKDGPAT